MSVDLDYPIKPSDGISHLNRVRTLRAANPQKEIVFGAVIATMFFVFFLGWCSVAQLDAAAAGSGIITVAGGSQIVQSKDGGVVAKLQVREGDHVLAGQSLVELESDEARGAERALLSRYIFRSIEVARLDSELSGEPLNLPAAFTGWTGDDRAMADLALSNAQLELGSQRRTNSARRQALQERIVQTRQQISGSDAEIRASEAQRQLTTQDLAGIKALADQGYAPANRVRALQKDVVALAGEAESKSAQVRSLEGSISETSSELERGDSERAAQASEELRTAESDLQSLEPQLHAAQSQLRRMMLSAPVTGDVVNLAVHATGAVVAPGQTLMTIVPASGVVVVAVNFQAKDTDGLKVGQEAKVRLPGLHSRATPVLKGKLTRISADAMTDERTGARYYTAEVSIPDGELDRLARAEGTPQLKLRLGQSAQILVTLKHRSALQYILEPLEGMFWGSLHEH